MLVVQALAVTHPVDGTEEAQVMHLTMERSHGIPAGVEVLQISVLEAQPSQIGWLWPEPVEEKVEAQLLQYLEDLQIAQMVVLVEILLALVLQEQLKSLQEPVAPLGQELLRADNLAP
jgi:hypothetical protein